MLMLDALFPPNPAQLVQDCKAVGAAGCFAYVWRPGGVGSWTPQHVTALRDAGLVALPIIVPAQYGGDIPSMVQALGRFGFTNGPVTLDLEPPNVPPSDWEETFDETIKHLGYTDLDYGTTSILGRYAPDDKDWIASWIRTGTLNPIPSLPAGRAAWQFVNDININGSQYDASVVDPFVLGGAQEDTMTDAEQIASLTAHVITAYVAFVHHYPSAEEIDAWVGQARPYDPAGMVTRIMSNLDSNGTPYIPTTEAQVKADIAASGMGGGGGGGIPPHVHNVGQTSGALTPGG